VVQGSHVVVGAVAGFCAGALAADRMEGARVRRLLAQKAALFNAASGDDHRLR